MSDMLKPEVFIDVERQRELQRLAWYGAATPAPAAEELVPHGLTPVNDTETVAPRVDNSEHNQEIARVVRPLAADAPNSFNWRSSMSCKGKTDLFFPPFKAEKKPRRLSREAKAKAVCASCPVVQFCLEKALQGDETGIWGGTDEDERRKIKLRRRDLLNGL